MSFKWFFLLILESLTDKEPGEETEKEISNEENRCEAGQDCVPADSCERFRAEKEKLNRLSQGSDQWKTLLEKLKSQVCNKEEKKICCDLPSPGNILTNSPSYSC